jgi:hypothetical protein
MSSRVAHPAADDGTLSTRKWPEPRHSERSEGSLGARRDSSLRRCLECQVRQEWLQCYAAATLALMATQRP